MQTEILPISKIKNNPNNPRLVKDDKFDQLVNSIKTFPEMLKIRPIVVNKDFIVLGGNMRLKACRAAGLKEIPIIQASQLTDEQQKEFIIKDNVGFGEWDWEMINAEWDVDKVEEWGLDLPIIEDMEKGDVYEDLGIKQSIQVIPKNEYIIITAPEESEEWEELKTLFKCETVRSGGCKVGSSSDKVGTGIERVFDLKTLKQRFGL